MVHTSRPGGTAVLVAPLGSHFAELFRVAQVLQGSGIRPVIVLDAYETASRHAADAEAVGVEILRMGESATPTRGGNRRRGRWRAKLGQTSLAFPVSTLLWVCRYSRRIRSVIAILRHLDARVVVLAEESVDYWIPAWVRAAHSVGVGVVVVPFTIPNPAEPAQALEREPRHSLVRFDNRLLSALAPRWRSRSVRVVRAPAPQAIALHLLRLAPARPWVLNDGAADIIAVESEAMLSKYREFGIEAERLSVTGSVVDDRLVSGLRDVDRPRKLRRKYDLAGRPLVVCAVPPDQFSARAHKTEYETYEGLVGSLLRALQPGRFDVLLAMHPRTPGLPTDIPPNVAVADEDLADLLPACDVFVACASATLRWAITCGKPAINYDVYRYGYDDFDEVDSVLHVRSEYELDAVMVSVAEDPTSVQSWSERQREYSPRFGSLDGNAGSRITALIESMANRQEM